MGSPFGLKREDPKSTVRPPHATYWFYSNAPSINSGREPITCGFFCHCEGLPRSNPVLCTSPRLSVIPVSGHIGRPANRAACVRAHPAVRPARGRVHRIRGLLSLLSTCVYSPSAGNFSKENSGSPGITGVPGGSIVRSRNRTRFDLGIVADPLLNDTYDAL